MPQHPELRVRHSFRQEVHGPALAAEITLQPIRRLDLVGTVVFSDIIAPLEAIGVELDLVPGSSLPPRSLAEISDADPEPEKDLAARRVASYLRGRDHEACRPGQGMCGQSDVHTLESQDLVPPTIAAAATAMRARHHLIEPDPGLGRLRPHCRLLELENRVLPGRRAIRAVRPVGYLPGHV